VTTQTDIQANLPLTEAVLFILLSLAPDPKHGYAIMKDVRALSENRVVLSTGTLYGALKRLLEQGWIERVEDTKDATEESRRPRKAYALTNRGRRIMDAEVARLRSLVAIAQWRVSEEPA
jgi:DNA-binding PadR family transcriptional regulator